MNGRDSNPQSQQARGKRPTPHRAVSGIGLCMYVFIYLFIYLCVSACMYVYTVMRRLTTGYLLRNASLGDFVVVRTS